VSGADKGTPLLAVRNLGPRSVQMLADADIHTLEQLREVSAAVAYARVKFLHPRSASKNLLWSLAAGVQGRVWSDLTEREKKQLEAELVRL
jgi:DNA transformation protein and related proteins